jgi:hypothetical protein
MPWFLLYICRKNLRAEEVCFGGVLALIEQSLDLLYPY